MDNKTTRKKNLRSPFVIGTPVTFCSADKASAILAERRCLVILIRHGVTEWNKLMKLQGREDIPLSEEGIAQAWECAATLADALTGYSVKGVFSSPLSRAYDTAGCLCVKLGAPPPRVLHKLIERDYGSLAGLTPEKRRELYPNPSRYPTDIESMESAAIRLKQAVIDIGRLPGNGVAVAVTHGGVMNAMFSRITSGRSGTGRNITANCAFALVAVGAGDVIPLAYNLCSKTFGPYIRPVLGALSE